MKHLEGALKQEKKQQSKRSFKNLKQRPKKQVEKWTLDADHIFQSPQEVQEKLTSVISAQINKKFQSQKYLQEQTFQELVRDLTSLFSHFFSELQKLAKIQEILQNLSDLYSGDLKNYLKHFQSLLDAKIRRLKKKGKRAELIDFDRFTKQAHPKPKNQVYFINQDDKHPKNQPWQEQDTSKKSFGTMNSGSNENESGSCKNKSGSGSKSGQSKALAVLLANIDIQQQRKGGKNKEKEKEKYEFTSILNATMNIRHRNNSLRLIPLNQTIFQQIQSEKMVEIVGEQDKDEAFIFHYPKHQRHKK